jgi:hypothetical protein
MVVIIKLIGLIHWIKRIEQFAKRDDRKECLSIQDTSEVGPGWDGGSLLS